MGNSPEGSTVKFLRLGSDRPVSGKSCKGNRMLKVLWEHPGRKSDPVLGRLPRGGDMEEHVPATSMGENGSRKMRTKVILSRKGSLGKGQVVRHSMILKPPKVAGA